MPDATIADLDRCGLFVALQPRRFGGLEMDPATFYESVVQVAAACSATGWVGGVLGAPVGAGLHVTAGTARRLGRRRPGPGVVVLCADRDRRRVADGYLVCGRWGFSSGVNHCRWSLLGAVVVDEEDLGIRVFLVPRSEARIDDDSWRVVGLAGTGSKDVHVAGAVVPDHRTHLIAELAGSRWDRRGGCSTPIRCTGCHG